MCCKYSESHHQGSPLHADPFPLGCESMLAAQQKKQLMVQRLPGISTDNNLSNTASYKGPKDQQHGPIAPRYRVFDLNQPKALGW